MSLFQSKQGFCCTNLKPWELERLYTLCLNCKTWVEYNRIDSAPPIPIRLAPPEPVGGWKQHYHLLVRGVSDGGEFNPP